MICRHLTDMGRGAFEPTKKGCRCTRCGLELDPAQAIRTKILMDKIPTSAMPEIYRAISIDIMFTGNEDWQRSAKNKYMTEVLNYTWFHYTNEKYIEKEKGGKKYA